MLFTWTHRFKYCVVARIYQIQLKLLLFHLAIIRIIDLVLAAALRTFPHLERVSMNMLPYQHCLISRKRVAAKRLQMKLALDGEMAIINLNIWNQYVYWITKQNFQYSTIMLHMMRRGGLSVTKPRVLTYLHQILFGGWSQVATNKLRNQGRNLPWDSSPAVGTEEGVLELKMLH